MGRQTYLLRRGGRYHFRRRFAFGGGNSSPIMLALGTADPIDARRIVNRLAVRWDMMSMQAAQRIERGTLTLTEQRALFRQGLEQELADATRHVTAPRRPAIDEASYSKVAVAAYTIVGSVPHDTKELSVEAIERHIDDGWTDAERRLLINMLRLYITPMSVSRDDAAAALEALGAPVNDGTASEARWNLIRGRIEAQKRAPLVDHPLFANRNVPALHLLDDDLVEQARRVTPIRPVAVEPAQATPVAEPTAASADSGYFARSTTIRFSEQLDNMLATMILNKKYKPDNGQRRRVLQTFAWITGDKPLSDYGPEDRIAFVKAMTAIPNTIRFGELDKAGPMAVPFDAAAFDAPTTATLRSGRTINRDLTILAAAEDVLHETHWRPRYGGDRVLNFLKSWAKIEEDFADPKRVPWTPEHLRTMYALPLWQGGGSANERIKPATAGKVWQDAAYWLPLFGTYMGVAREEGAGFEVADFNFDCEVPYVLVQANMTRSKDGVTKAGLKRKARHRVLPLHPELLRLGIQRYVESMAAEGHAMIFPELYLPEAKYAPRARKGGGDGAGNKAEAFGGRRFYAISWCFLMDATHGVMPLPETSDGKKADFHSQRTYNNSVLASPEVSQTIIDKHMGHAPTGTGPRRYMRRSLALGEVRELRERLDVMVRQMPIVTDHVPVPETVNLLPLVERSRVGSAPGRNAKHRFCA